LPANIRRVEVADGGKHSSLLQCAND